MLHATALVNGLAGDWIVPVPPVVPWGRLCWSWVGWPCLHAAGGGYASLLTLAFVLVALLASVVAYVQGLWWSALPTVAGLVLHFQMGAAHSYWRERQRRQQLHRHFSLYVPPAVVDAMVAAGAACGAG